MTDPILQHMNYENSSAEENEEFLLSSKDFNNRPQTIFDGIRRGVASFFGGKSWRFGLYAGFYASIVVLLSNLALVLVGSLSHGGIVDGIGTIAKGEAQDIERLSIRYHVFINVLSTILLTSSNYAMQILCAPTRDEIDRAHSQGQWTEIGIMSIHNLFRIDRRRAALWLTLSISSMPLHLLFNSSVFTVVTGQDYQVSAANESSLTPETMEGWRQMSNQEWRKSYSVQYVSGLSDLQLVIGNVSVNMRINQNWTYALEAPLYSSNRSYEFACGWEALTERNGEVPYPVSLDSSFSRAQPTINPDRRLVYNLSMSNPWHFPGLLWPKFPSVNVSDQRTLADVVKFCHSDSNKVDWLLEHPLHVRYGLAKVIPNASKVQIALPFLVIVICANVAKVLAIFFTLRNCSSGHIITIGDAISTFLEHPETATKGKGTHGKSELVRFATQTKVEPWWIRKKPIVSVLGGRRFVTSLTLVVTISLNIWALAAACKGSYDLYHWGTASDLLVPFTSSSFDTKGVLKNAWLANLPQVALSLVYFTINRLCTSVCCIKEWNNYATHRKGLRVTSPQGLQRSTHFLQLPYRYAIPLVTTSGILHWLLSQSVFLVRREVRDRNGGLYPTSTCACGYSVVSLVAFTAIFFTLLGLILYMVLRTMEVRMPPIRHCSIVISAACHPPLDDHDPHLKKVKWGVVELGSKDKIGHCTFTSKSVTKACEGALYA